ncbi:protein of unknown function DUF748 [Rhodoferax ferrireducens T118]|uniref:DUF748 domain-containing protein n=1 Tax=Albidiferax ferrireducens (strain ATCC BAA-621 / DSM 15236 / T118) TaxID=338969 RepID=Q222N5_ALBFT|nr:DUF748 domain-containing protein [Rhodoferax ferrireducens]ABD68018.1 protein of unknown function DUF748 [Rhodoferax ferrireducens T118]
MARQSLQWTNIRWKRWVAGAAGLLAAYTVAGFWLVPPLIKHQVPQFGQTELARQATIGEVRFNPFTLRLEAQDLRLAEADGTPLFAVGKLAVALQWKSLIRRAWSFSDIRITAPSANLAIAPDGKFNLAELLATLERRPHEASTDASLPRVIVEQLALEQGTVDMHDRRAGYDNTFAPIDFSLSNFSTLPEQNDAHTFTAQSARGGKMRWKGTASVNPIRASGEVTLENASLPELAVYLKSYTRARVAAGQLSATLPYSLSYADGKFEASLEGAKVSLRDLALAREGVTDSFAALTRLDINDVNADLARRQVTVGEVRADGGKLSVKRDAKGELDLTNLMIASAGPAASGPAAAVAVNNWKLAVKQVLFDQMAVSAVDETAKPPLKLNAGKVRLQLQVAAEQAGANFQLKLSQAALSLAGLTLASGAQAPFKLAQLGFSDGMLDLAARQASIGRLYAEGGQLQLVRARDGKLNLMELLPRSSAIGPQAAAAAGKPWVAVAKTVELSKFGADVADEGAGVKVQVTDLALKLEGASSDLKQTVKFNTDLKLREGGQFTAQGSVVPANGEVQADVRLKQLALAPLQPLLAHYLKLKIARGNVSAQGLLTTGAGTAKSPSLRYVGALNVAGLTLNEEDGGLFAAWKNASADKFTASLNPNRLDVPELRIVEPNATLIIEDDRSFNAARLLVQPNAGAKVEVPTQAKAKADDDPFPVRIRRLRLQNAKLDFTDLSLRPQFSAKIYELNGVINGLSSNREARSQIELDGRVDEFGLARIRGELNPFAPRNNTDINVVFKNVDMVPASPYSMKFAGYKVAEGKISLDLQYKIRDSQLEGANQIVIDKLTLGERVDSPDALKLPLQLAIAILKDSEGRIDLGLPISGNLSDPQFSYGAIIWKAIGNLLTRIVTAPFRALGSLLGVSGEKLESIDFDAGSDRLLPPEREKLKQVAQILGKRAQLKLSVPAQYSETADGAALRAGAVRVEIARRAGIKLQAGEEPGPLNLSDRAVRGAMRDLYAERFGEAELDKQKKAAEGGGAPAAAASMPDTKTAAAQAKLPLWQRVGKMIQGEPQVADASAFYNQLQERLNQNQPLAADALAKLGAQRAEAILAALKEAGVDPARADAAAPEKVESDIGKPVPLKLGLVAK